MGMTTTAALLPRSSYSMHYPKIRVACLLTAVALLTGACGGDDPLPTTPTTPIVSINETFSGTLTPFSARTHTFDVQNAGDVIVQITAIDPADTVVGLSVGTTNGFACQAAISTEKAVLNAGLTGVARAAGTLCARIYDPSDSGLPGPVTYSLQITHY
jgi:hypothetical protein